MVTMHDVAKHAGVSVATVSHVINNRITVREETRQRVLDSIEALHYEVNLVARGLKTQRTSTIGLILPDITKLFFQRLITGVLNAASESGYRVSIMSSNYNFETERQLVQQQKANLVDGLIIDSCAPMDQAQEWLDTLAQGSGKSVPIVMMDNMSGTNRISSVTVDNKAASMIMTQHLIDIGCRQILYLAGPLHLEHAHERLVGYRQCLSKNGITPNPNLERTSSYTSEAGYYATLSAIRDGLHFDAVEASNDQEAIGVIKALNETSLSIPNDVAVSGFDNLFPATLITPGLTTISIPNYEMGEVATRQLIRQITDPEAMPQNHILQTELVIRASTIQNIQTQWNLQGW